jgi:hypothetical protein
MPDMEGTYTATLVVSDFISSSLPDGAVITVNGANLPPPTVVVTAKGFDPVTSQTVKLGSGIPTEVGHSVTLDGSESHGTFDYLLVFQWSVVERPLTSVAALSDAQAETTQITPEVPGTYTVRLTVEDGFNEAFADFSFVAALPDDGSGGTGGPQPANPPQAQVQPSGGCSLVKIP